jgi:microcystin-dependent protein
MIIDLMALVHMPLRLVYRVGDLKFTTNPENPATYYGFGTWSLWGSGRVPVGVNASDTDFATVEKTGGEKKHALTIAEMPAHDHPGAQAFKVDGVRAGIYNGTGAAGGSYTWNSQATYSGNGVNSYRMNSQGDGANHNNMPPYITCYMWKRTA